MLHRPHHHGADPGTSLQAGRQRLYRRRHAGRQGHGGDVRPVPQRDTPLPEGDGRGAAAHRRVPDFVPAGDAAAQA